MSYFGESITLTKAHQFIMLCVTLSERRVSANFLKGATFNLERQGPWPSYCIISHSFRGKRSFSCGMMFLAALPSLPRAPDPFFMENQSKTKNHKRAKQRLSLSQKWQKGKTLFTGKLFLRKELINSTHISLALKTVSGGVMSRIQSLQLLREVQRWHPKTTA